MSTVSARTLRQPRRTPTIILAALAVSLLVNLVLSVVLLPIHPQGSPPATRPTGVLPCQAIPTKLILEDPACADKLIQAMNVTGVRVLPKDR